MLYQLTQLGAPGGENFKGETSDVKRGLFAVMGTIKSTLLARVFRKIYHTQVSVATTQKNQDGAQQGNLGNKSKSTHVNFV